MGKLVWIREPAHWATCLGGSRSVLFLCVPWSGDALTGLDIVRRAAERWIDEYGPWPVSWSAVDVDEAGAVPLASVTEPLASITDWLTTQQQVIGVSAGQLIIGGHGPLVWIRQGAVVGFVRAVSASLEAHLVNGLVEQTRELFGVKPSFKGPRLWRTYRLHQLPVPFPHEMIGLGESRWKQLLNSSTMAEIYAKYEFYSMKIENASIGTDDLQVVMQDLEGAYRAIGEQVLGYVPSDRGLKRPWDPESGRCRKLRAFWKDFSLPHHPDRVLTIEVARSLDQMDWSARFFASPTALIEEDLDTHYCWLDMHFPENTLEKQQIENRMRQGADLCIAGW